LPLTRTHFSETQADSCQTDDEFFEIHYEFSETRGNFSESRPKSSETRDKFSETRMILTETQAVKPQTCGNMPHRLNSSQIMHRLEVNGVTGGEANRLFQRAMSERISTIRGVYWRRIVTGGLLLVVGIGLFAGIAFLTEDFRVFNILTIIVPAGVATFGAWRFFGGVIGVVTAASRTGPISEID
jgi:hypothetical protein